MFTQLLADVDIASNLFSSSPTARDFTATPGSIISTLLPNILILAGVILVILIIKSGYDIISLSGSGNPQAISKAKLSISYGLIGFLIVALAYFILQITSQTLTGSDILINTPATLNP